MVAKIKKLWNKYFGRKVYCRISTTIYKGEKCCKTTIEHKDGLDPVQLNGLLVFMQEAQKKALDSRKASGLNRAERRNIKNKIRSY
jgi:hypothetical protein